MRRRAPTIEVIDDQMAEVFRRMTPAQRLHMVDQIYLSSRQLIAASIRESNASMTDDQVEREVARRIRGDAE
jgi:hypothetical protein